MLAAELDDEGDIVREFDDTPHDFGRIAAMTAKQVILQRLREATDEVHFGEYAGRDGDLVTGVIQAHEGRAEKGIVSVDLGKIEAMLPPSEQVPGELYEHGMRIKCIVVHVAKGFRGPQITLSRTAPQPGPASCSSSKCRRSPTAPYRSPRSPARPATVPRSRCGPPQPGVNAKGACIGPMGQRVRAVMSELHGEKIDIIDWSDDPATFVGNALSPAKALRVDIVDEPCGPPGSPSRTISCRWRSGGRGRMPDLRQV